MKTRLQSILERLEKRYGILEQRWHEPFDIVMWENAGYLVDDKRRQDILDELHRRVGPTPAALLEAPRQVLEELATRGGMRPQQRVEKWLETAALALKPLPTDLSQARRSLRGYPGIGAPGVDKIMLFGKRQAVLALDSNGLRVLLRLGYAQETRDYAVTYRAVQQAAQTELAADCDALIRAHLMLRRHGQEVCRRTRPQCLECPVAKDCPSAQACT